MTWRLARLFEPHNDAVVDTGHGRFLVPLGDGYAVKLLDPVPSVATVSRKPADDMAVIVEDLIKVLDRVGNDLRRGRRPEKSRAEQVATLLRAVADDLEA